MMNIYKNCLVSSLVVLSPLLGLGSEASFPHKGKPIENVDIASYLGENLANILPASHLGAKCRYQELGALSPQEQTVGEPKGEVEIAAFRYLERVQNGEWKKGSLSSLGVCSPFLTDKKRLDISGELSYLERALQGKSLGKIVTAKQEDTLGVSLFLVSSLSDPFSIEGGFVALVKKDNKWKACVTPESFANTNMTYDGGLRLRSQALEQWAKNEVPKLKKQAEMQSMEQAKAKLEELRQGLAKADSAMLLGKLARGLGARNAAEIAAVFNAQGGVKGTVDELEHTRQENSGSFLDCLSGSRCIIVPLDPKPVSQSKEEVEARKQERLNHGRDNDSECNGEKGDDCALGIIAVKPYSRYSSRQSIAYYLPLHYCPANDSSDKKSMYALDRNVDDKRPCLRLNKELVENAGRIQDWELVSMSSLVTTKRIARDFHRSYPAFQFKTAEEALTFILLALKEERFTDLLRCLPPKNFTSGGDLMRYVDDLVKLSEQAGISVLKDQGDRDEWVAQRFNPKKKVSSVIIEDVILYDKADEALALWRLSKNSLMQIKLAHIVLRKEGDVWYLVLPSDPVPQSAGILGKIAAELKIAYNANQSKRIYGNVTVLKKPKPVRDPVFGVRSANAILELASNNKIAELLKRCLLLEDSPIARQRLEAAVKEHLQGYGKDSPVSASECSGGDGLWCVSYSLYFSHDGKLREAPMLLFVEQDGKLFWVPELTLFSSTTLVRMMLSNKRLNVAKQFLEPGLYASYLNAYRQHCQKVEQRSKQMP